MRNQIHVPETPPPRRGRGKGGIPRGVYRVHHRTRYTSAPPAQTMPSHDRVRRAHSVNCRKQANTRNRCNRLQGFSVQGPLRVCAPHVRTLHKQDEVDLYPHSGSTVAQHRTLPHSTPYSSAPTHASATPAQFSGVSGAGAKASDAAMVTGRRIALASECESADMRARQTKESCSCR